MKWISFVVLFIPTLVMASSQEQVVKRYRLHEDRFRTLEMLRPVDRDFYLDMTGVISGNVLDFADEAQKVFDTPGNQQSKLDVALPFLRGFNNTEQTMNISIKLGAPLPKFNPWNIKIKPRLFIDGRLGANLITEVEPLNFQNILNLVEEPLNPAIEAAIITLEQNNGFSEGEDIVVKACQQAGIALSNPVCVPQGKYYYPGDTVPNVKTLVKGDAKAGLNFDWEYGENFFGTWGVYGLYRIDLFKRISQFDLTVNGDVFDLPDKKNDAIWLNTDFMVGYKKDFYRAWLALEEVKVAEISERDADSLPQAYGNIRPLLRIHGDARFNLSFFTLTPFAGLHKRSGYNMEEGLYLGADGEVGILGDGVTFRGRLMLDKEHLTISPKFKIFVMHLDYALKLPIEHRVRGVRTSTIHALNFRLFF